MNNRLLITGSSRGIGASIARSAKSAGFDVLLHGSRRSPELLKIAEELDAPMLVFDVTDEKSVKKEMDKIGHLHALVNSAGVNISKPFEELTIEDWKVVYSVNVFGMATVIRHCLPLFEETGQLCRIVNIASVKGIYAAAGRPAYSSAKAAVVQLTSALAKELAPKVLVNCVSPGFTATDMTSETWSERIEKQVDSILLGRMASPDEIATAVQFFYDRRCTYITGQNLIVDGGFSLKND